MLRGLSTRPVKSCFSFLTLRTTCKLEQQLLAQTGTAPAERKCRFQLTIIWVKGRMYYSATDKLHAILSETPACFIRLATPGIHRTSLRQSSSQNRAAQKAISLVSTPAGPGVLPVPPCFSLRFAKSCVPVFISRSRKTRKHSGWNRLFWAVYLSFWKLCRVVVRYYSAVWKSSHAFSGGKAVKDLRETSPPS